MKRPAPPERTRRALALALALTLVLAGCAQTPKTPRPPGHWSGRLALQVQDAPAQSFSAGFELQGDAQKGELRLLTPLGGVHAVLAWSTCGATLMRGSEVHNAQSLHALLGEMGVGAVPVAALFSWLAGDGVAADGWSADLSALASGRLQATREHPGPRTTLRVVLDR